MLSESATNERDKIKIEYEQYYYKSQMELTYRDNDRKEAEEKLSKIKDKYNKLDRENKET